MACPILLDDENDTLEKNYKLALIKQCFKLEFQNLLGPLEETDAGKKVLKVLDKAIDRIAKINITA